MVKKIIAKILYHISIRTSLILFSVIGLILPTIILSFIIFKNTQDYLKNSLTEIGQQVVHNSVSQLDSILENINYASVNLSTNSTVIKTFKLLNNNDKSAEAFFTRDDSMKLISGVKNANLNSLNAEISMITLAGDVISPDALEHIVQEDLDFLLDYFQENRVYYHDISKDPPGLSLTSIRPVYNNKRDIIGFIYIKVPEYIIEKRLNVHELIGSGSVYLYDGNGSLVLTNEHKQAGNNISIGEEVQITQETGGLTFLFRSTTDAVHKRLNQMRSTTYLALGGLFVFQLFILSLIVKFTNRPIKQMIHYVNELKTGNLTAKNKSVYYTDLELLNKNLYEMANRIDYLMNDAIEKERQKEKIYYEMLSAQINPHFIHNTLNSIRWMATLGGNDNVSEMITELNKILAHIFKKDSKTITLERELEIIGAYIKIQKMRYGEMFSYKDEVAEVHRSVIIPKFILQPVVENAIEHGVFSTSQGITRISSATEDGALVISVTDNGVGMRMEEAKALFVKASKSSSADGIGLSNVNQRIKIECGEQYGVFIESEPGNGCTVKLKLPLEQMC